MTGFGPEDLRSIDAGQMQVILDSAPSGLILVDGAGTIRFCNAAVCLIFGYSDIELLGANVDMLLPDELQGAHSAQRHSFFEAPSVRPMGAGRDLFARHKDGRRFPVELGLNPVPIHGVMMAMASVVDISERVKHESSQRTHQHQLELLNQKFEGVLAASPYGMISSSASGAIRYANAAATELFGYTNDELLKMNLDELLPLESRGDHPAQRGQFFENPVVRAMGTSRDLRGLRKDGVEFPVEVGLNPMDTDHGLEVLASVIDITERKKRKLELERANLKLAHANSALAESNVELQQFAYIASHDLQTPLRGVASFAAFLQEDYADKLDPEGQGYLNRIIDGAGRMKKLIEDLLTYSRVESQAVPFVPVDLDHVLDEVLLLLDSSIRELGVELTRDPLLRVLGDRGQLTQLLQNLVGNGIKYHGDKPAKVHVSASIIDGEPVLSVRDQGIGIAPEYHDRVFEIFRRLHTQQEYPGTGIGLAVCSRIAKRHGARIGIQSVLGEGATIHVTFPDRAVCRED